MGVGAGLLGEMRQLDGFGGRVGAGAGDDRNPLGRLFDHQFDQLAMFLHVDGRRLAGGPDNDNGIRTLGHMPVHQTAHGRQVEGAAFVHGGDDGNDGTLNHGDS